MHVHHQMVQVAAALEGDHRQFHGCFLAAGSTQCVPLETQAHGSHDRGKLLADCLQHTGRRFLLKLSVQRNRGQRSPLLPAECRQDCQQQADGHDFHL